MHLVLSGNVKAISTAVFDNFMLLPKYAYLIILCTLTFVINIRKKNKSLNFIIMIIKITINNLPI